ncbi:MAG: response regulator [Clostridia bacterium]|nr:response regulator [Clostridia bacterium]
MTEQQRTPARIAIVDDEPITRMDLRCMLEDLGYTVTGEAGDGFDAVQLCKQDPPDLVLMDVKMPVFDGLTAAERILSERLAGCVVLLTAFNDTEIIEAAKRIGVTGYLVKPVEQRLLRPTVEMALAQAERLRSSERETETVKKQLSDAKTIARAQAVLAKREGITETEAYTLLRKLSMDKRLPMAALAEAVLRTEK